MYYISDPSIAATEEEAVDLERVQKVACKIILLDNYIDYEHALESQKLDTLKARRNNLCLKFAKKCVKHPQSQWNVPTEYCCWLQYLRQRNILCTACQNKQIAWQHYPSATMGPQSWSEEIGFTYIPNACCGFNLTTHKQMISIL